MRTAGLGTWGGASRSRCFLAAVPLPLRSYPLHPHSLSLSFRVPPHVICHVLPHHLGPPFLIPSFPPIPAKTKARHTLISCNLPTQPPPSLPPFLPPSLKYLPLAVRGRARERSCGHKGEGLGSAGSQGQSSVRKDAHGVLEKKGEEKRVVPACGEEMEGWRERGMVSGCGLGRILTRRQRRLWREGGRRRPETGSSAQDLSTLPMGV